MKKLRFLFCFLFVLFALGSISVFAADTSSANYRDYFRTYRFLAHNVPADDFTYSYSGNNQEDWYDTYAAWDGDGLPPSSYAYSFRTTFSRQSNDEPLPNATMLPPGYVLSGTFRFKVQFRYPDDIGDLFSPNDLQHAIVMLYDYPDGDFWSITGRTKVSDIKFIGSYYSSDFGTVWECSADFYFHNDTSEYIDMRKNSFQFMFRFKNAAAFPCLYRFATFFNPIENFYYGRADSASAPAFKDYDVYNEVLDEESELVGGVLTEFQDQTQEFTDIYESLHGDNLFLQFGGSLNILSSAFNYIVVDKNTKSSFLEGIFYVSVFFGICGFLLNILPSMVSKFKARDIPDRRSNKGDSGGSS